MEPCPCGSGRDFAECCQPVITREREAATAEELMRSRYSAFVTADIDWIMDSHHPDTVDEVKRDDVESWATGSEWLGLRVRDTVDGGPGDDEGIVDFRARYKVGTQQVDHVERARFVRVDGAWRFHSVVEEEGPELVPVGPASTVGRNDPCPCGSGKKYKKCHGAAA
ncbi:MAG: YchJ family protein [Thermoleophilia bacterium]|nr:YchJ family protein [Thermoleophilia bacterium]